MFFANKCKSYDNNLLVSIIIFIFAPINNKRRRQYDINSIQKLKALCIIADLREVGFPPGSCKFTNLSNLLL